MRNINKKQNLVEQARINLDKEKNLHQITKYKVEKLETIIKEVREYIVKNTDNTNFIEVPANELLSILDKVEENK